MRILMVHNAYRQRGGEDAVVEAETSLLKQRGNDVLELLHRNDDVKKSSSLSLALNTLWSRSSAELIRTELARFRPDVIHVHNTLPMLSPSIYWAAHELGVPVVQTLHNFRLICPQALLLREGRVCEDCVGRTPLPGIVHGCYRGSRAQTAVVAGMLMLHRGLGTYRHKISRYIALNEFCRGKFIQGGLPADRIAIKPNFVDLPAPEPVQREGLLFVGRLSFEKGVHTLAEAAAGAPDIALDIVGEGPDSAAFDVAPHVRRVGAQRPEQVIERMRRAQALVLPSIWYENFPRTLVEAFACGLPVIASRLGAMEEIVEDKVTGLLVPPGQPQAWRDAMRWAQANPEAMATMGRNAREKFERYFSADVNYRRLMEIYKEAHAATFD